MPNDWSSLSFAICVLMFKLQGKEKVRTQARGPMAAEIMDYGTDAHRR